MPLVLDPGVHLRRFFDVHYFVGKLTYRPQPGVADDARYRIGGTGVRAPVDLVVVSAGKDHGREALIRINATDASPHRRGYNVVVVDPRSGEVVGRDAFDTFIARAESARLAEFIRRIPAGAIVAAAIKDDGVGQLAGDAALAFRSVGGRADLRSGGLFGLHVLIGVKGAPAGSAVEALGPARLTRVVGQDRRDGHLVIEDFRLE